MQNTSIPTHPYLFCFVRLLFFSFLKGVFGTAIAATVAEADGGISASGQSNPCDTQRRQIEESSSSSRRSDGVPGADGDNSSFSSLGSDPVSPVKKK